MGKGLSLAVLIGLEGLLELGVAEQLVLLAVDLHLVFLEGVEEALVDLLLEGSLYLLQDGLVPALHVVDLDDLPHELQSLGGSGDSYRHLELCLLDGSAVGFLVVDEVVELSVLFAPCQDDDPLSALGLLPVEQLPKVLNLKLVQLLL